MDQGLNVPSVENLNRRSLCPCFPLQEQGPRSPVEEGAGIPTAAALREGSFSPQFAGNAIENSGFRIEH